MSGDDDLDFELSDDYEYNEDDTTGARCHASRQCPPNAIDARNFQPAARNGQELSSAGVEETTQGHSESAQLSNDTRAARLADREQQVRCRVTLGPGSSPWWVVMLRKLFWPNCRLRCRLRLEGLRSARDQTLLPK